MKLDLKIEVEYYQKPGDGKDSWEWTGCRCKICKEEMYYDRYYDRNDPGHGIVECLEGLAVRIEKLENQNGPIG